MVPKNFLFDLQKNYPLPHPTNPIYLGNRSAVYIAKNQYNLALRDSKEATNLDNTYIKGYSRQIKCNIALGNLAAAKSICDEIRNGVVLTGDFDELFKGLDLGTFFFII